MTTFTNSSGSIHRYICTPPQPPPPSTPHYLIYFITGNPGLISYYTSYLNTLASLLSQNGDKLSETAYTIAGQSLLGFGEVQGQHGPGPFSLETVIGDVFDSIVEAVGKGEKERGAKYDGIILMGHSVGGYISLEVLRRLRAAAKKPLRLKSRMDPVAAVLLFPTVTHIAQSPSGVKISKLFERFENLPALAHTISQWGFWPLSNAALKGLIKMVMRMDDSGSEATARFLKSELGVKQALFMARDEMQTIAEDRWDEEIWGVEEEGEDEKGEVVQPPRLVFFFGSDDHWVADHTRDALIKARLREGNKRVKMVIDKNRIPHGFCIHHSEQVAEKVAVWVQEIVAAEQKA